ncbi:tripartite-type tricarboxylate transporter receptor subunit TctC [Humitalea rosea]|uniref:Tripartite-type tricarboxylate transporter receptor subunit TctC n=1 Tax=Humitalea rosea TaxID=990373 RepID=A0A2W7I5M2_9PROT|nr:tripartite tricarboxylate transporter substrate-binding protein [Humitalea rosea]PZW42176.1 tripartite-type tricarboxylate transporter receptor subunit TctC [Humitalea rosea]
MSSRRGLLAASLGAPFVSLPALAQGQPYPSRAVSLLVGFAPGGGTDIIARFLQPSLQTMFGQAVLIDNRAGASGTLAAAANARARPDGYTMLMTTVSASAVVPPQMKPVPFDILTDQTAVVLAGTVPLVAVVPLDSPVRDLAGFIAHAKANPGKLNYSSSGVATQQHLAAALLGVSAGLDMTHVPFRGTGQAVNEVLAGRIDLAIDTLPTYLPHLRAGRVRAIATTLPERVEWLPDVPTIAESGFPGFDASVWYMIMGPPGLPEPIAARWVAAVNTALQEPVLRQRIRDSGFLPGGGTQADAAALLRRDAARYAALIRDADIRIE